MSPSITSAVPPHGSFTTNGPTVVHVKSSNDWRSDMNSNDIPEVDEKCQGHACGHMRMVDPVLGNPVEARPFHGRTCPHAAPKLSIKLDPADLGLTASDCLMKFALVH